MNNAKKNNTNKIDGDRNKVYEFLFINDKNTQTMCCIAILGGDDNDDDNNMIRFMWCLKLCLLCVALLFKFKIYAILYTYICAFDRG